MSLLSPLYEKTTKSAILSILSDEKPMTAKRIFTLVRKRHGLSVSYQAVHKALHEMIDARVLTRNQRVYQLSDDWIAAVQSFASKVGQLYSITPSAESWITETRLYTSPNDLYHNMIRMCRKNKLMRFSSKTPALIIPSEAEQSPLRQKYYDTVMGGIKSGRLRVKYLFSTELTRRKLLEDGRLETIQRFKELADNKNITLRHAPLHSIIAMAIAQKECLIGWASPAHTDLVGTLHIMAKNMDFLVRIYDNIFINAHEPTGLIKELEAALTR